MTPWAQLIRCSANQVITVRTVPVAVLLCACVHVTMHASSLCTLHPHADALSEGAHVCLARSYTHRTALCCWSMVFFITCISTKQAKFRYGVHTRKAIYSKDRYKLPSIANLSSFTMQAKQHYNSHTTSWEHRRRILIVQGWLSNPP